MSASLRMSTRRADDIRRTHGRRDAYQQLQAREHEVVDFRPSLLESELA